MTEFECEVCGYKTTNRFEVHTQANNSEKGFRYICCRCLGHKLLECYNKNERLKRRAKMADLFRKLGAGELRQKCAVKYN